MPYSRMRNAISPIASVGEVESALWLLMAQPTSDRRGLPG